MICECCKMTEPGVCSPLILRPSQAAGVASSQMGSTGQITLAHVVQREFIPEKAKPGLKGLSLSRLLLPGWSDCIDDLNVGGAC